MPLPPKHLPQQQAPSPSSHHPQPHLGLLLADLSMLTDVLDEGSHSALYLAQDTDVEGFCVSEMVIMSVKLCVEFLH